MPAPDLETLKDIASQVEQALKGRLSDILPAFAQRDADSLPSERVDIMFTEGPWTGHWGVRQNGILAHAAFRYMLTLNIYSRRPPANVPDPHAKFVARVKRVTIDSAADPTFLPYHTLADLNEQSNPERVVVDKDLDFTSIIYEGIVVIRSDAWPVE